jgi:hypothetical protein
MALSDSPLDSRGLNEMLTQRPSGPCWGVKLYLGSMVLFDFGGRLLVTRSRGSVYVGTTSLSIQNAYWEFTQGNQQILTATDVSAHSFDAMVAPLIIQQSIHSIDVNLGRGILQFEFTNKLSLELDFTGRWPTEDLIAELTMSDGYYVKFLLGGSVVVSADRDLLRQHAFEQAAIRS